MITTENGRTSAYGDLNELLNDLADVIDTVRKAMCKAIVPEEEAAQLLAKAIAIGIVVKGGTVEEATIVEVPEWMK